MNNNYWGLILVILSTLGYSLLATLSNGAYAYGLNVSTLLFLRFLVSSILLWGIVFIYKIPYKTSLYHFTYLLIVGTIGFGFASTFMFNAYLNISSSLATIIVFMHPAIIMIFESLYQKRAISSQKVTALVMTLLGLGIVVWDGNLTINLKGILFSLLAAVSYSIYAIGLTESNTKKMHSIAVYAYILSSCCLFNLVLILIGGNGIHLPSSNTGYVYVIALALFATILPSLCFNVGLRIIGPSSATIVSAIEPIFVAMLGFVFLSEPITINLVLGSIVIILSIVILQKNEAGKGTEKSLQKNETIEM